MERGGQTSSIIMVFAYGTRSLHE